MFTDKNLKRTTIAGYRTAIADHLGSLGVEISHSYELKRLIFSFDKDRPMKDRAIPSLIFLALSPIEPLKDVL